MTTHFEEAAFELGFLRAETVQIGRGCIHDMLSIELYRDFL